jgi:hypothetical protein
VEQRAVQLGPIIDGLRVVREGLKPDDWVIVNGMQRARAGTQVDPQKQEISVRKDPQDPDADSLAPDVVSGTERRVGR